MSNAPSSEHFFNATMRHFAELRNAGPEAAASSEKFPKDWFDLSEETLADLGAMTFLLSLTRYHRDRTLAQIFELLEPPLRLRQYRLFRSNGFPRAFITWAGLSPDAERRFAVDHMPLQKGDWNSGASPWLVEFAAPFGHIDQIVPMLSRNPSLKHVRTLWHNKTGERYRIVEWSRPVLEEPVRVKSYGVNQFAKHLNGEG